MSDTNRSRQGGRLVFIDIARSLAIVLALSAHALSTYQPPLYVDYYTHVKLVTILATPLFVFMFGFMMEFVYVHRAMAGETGPVSRRLLVRSFQCYLAYALTALAGWAGGYVSGGEFLSSLVLLEDAKYGNILRTYALALLVMIPLIVLRVRFGKYVWLVSLVLLYLSFSRTGIHPDWDLGRLGYVASRFLGIGSVRGGPSLWHAFAFIFAGMFVATSVREGGRVFYASCLAVALVALVGHLSVNEDSIGTVLRRLAYGDYRGGNDIRYFALTTICCLVILLTIRHAPGPLRNFLAERSYFMSLGRSSLLSFMLGNVILSLTGAWVLHYVSANVAFVLFFVILAIVIRHHKKVPSYAYVRERLYFEGTASV